MGSGGGHTLKLNHLNVTCTSALPQHIHAEMREFIQNDRIHYRSRFSLTSDETSLLKVTLKQCLNDIGSISSGLDDVFRQRMKLPPQTAGQNQWSCHEIVTEENVFDYVNAAVHDKYAVSIVPEIYQHFYAQVQYQFK